VLIPLVVAVGIAAVPASLSVALRPWSYAVKIAAVDLPGETTLVELARVESLHIYAGTLQTLMTPVNDWPTANPRDACLIETAPKDAGAPPPTSTWTNRTIRRMFNDRVDPAEARRAYYEREVVQAGEAITAVAAEAYEVVEGDGAAPP